VHYVETKFWKRNGLENVNPQWEMNNKMHLKGTQPKLVDCVYFVQNMDKWNLKNFDDGV
jgi:hypothetical protein